jgi:hypothetical protein
MDQQDGGTDPVKQGNRGIAVERLLRSEVHERRKLACIELVEGCVAGLAAARPLAVQMRLGPEIVAFRRHEALLQPQQIGIRDRPVRLRPLRCPATRHLIDHIDGVAAAQEILRPALATVRCAGEIGAGLAAAVNHHHRIGVAQLLRHLEFHIHVADGR